MTTKLRVFVSSTMKDLANERDAVCQKLRDFNFEPVNAEGWPPTGADSWTRISEELRSSHAFVLLLGESYGWVPKTGAKSELALSVTEIEYTEARALDIPVLPFLKELTYGTERTSDDAKKRDEFRERVKDWEKGSFVKEFKLARELAEMVGHALIEVLTSDFLRSRVDKRLAAAVPTAGGRDYYVRPPWIPEQAIKDILTHEAILFAGAGMSLAAGLPSAAALAQYLAEAVRAIDPAYSSSWTVASVAADLESVASRSILIERVKALVNPTRKSISDAHEAAVQLFDTIFTTNWDDLFEQALHVASDERPVIAAEINGALPRPVLVKLHGSPEQPTSLLLTEADISQMDRTRSELWRQAVTLLQSREVIVVGASLRDPSMVRLFEEASPQVQGYFVAPNVSAADRQRLKRWNLSVIDTMADEFFRTVLSNRRNPGAG